MRYLMILCLSLTLGCAHIGLEVESPDGVKTKASYTRLWKQELGGLKVASDLVNVELESQKSGMEGMLELIDLIRGE